MNQAVPGVQNPNENSSPSTSSPTTTTASTTSPQQPKPRLIISKLRMENFKSYGGVQEIGPFHKSFTAIIGPNGSGKSNVIDAMLFVFGRRANQIRLKKLSELIHNSYGSGDINHCSVEVHFCYIIDDVNDKDAYSVVEGTQFCVKRVVTRSNQSQYFIDNQPATVHQVVEKLKTECHIDLDHNRFLILQGEVEQIATMKPKATPGSSETGLLEYLEDIIGSSKYKKDIDLQQDITEGLTQLRQTKLAEQDTLKRQLMMAKGSVDEKIQYLENEYVYANTIYLDHMYQYYHFTNFYFRTADRMIKAKTEHAQIFVELKRLSRLKAQAEGKNRDDHRKMAQLNEQIQNLTKEFTLLEEQHNKLDKKKSKLIQVDIPKAEEKKDAELVVVETMKKTKREYETKLPLLEAEAKSVEEDIENQRIALDEKVATTTQLTEPYKKRLTELTQQNEPFLRQLDDAKQQVMKLKGELGIIEARLTKNNQGQRDLQHEIETTKDAVAALEAEIEQMEGHMKTLAGERGKIQAEMKESVGHENELKAKLAKANQDMHELHGKIADLNSNNNMDDDYNPQQQHQHQQQQGASSVNLQKMTPCQRLLEQKYQFKNPSLQGVYGRIADICYVDPRFEVAMANAMGDAQHILVTNSATAHAAMTFFRENNYGRASFLPLDANSVTNARKRYLEDQRNPIVAPEGSQRLFDLVKFPEHIQGEELELFKTTLFKTIGDTFVCPDVTTASRVAFADPKRPRRTVALSGEVMQTSGAMSGGRVKRFVFASNLIDCKERMMPAVFTANNNNQVAQQRNKKRQEEDVAEASRRRIESEKLNGDMMRLRALQENLTRQIDNAARKKSDNLSKLQQIGSSVQHADGQLKELRQLLVHEQDNLKTHEETLKHVQNQNQRRDQDTIAFEKKNEVIQKAKEVVAELEQQQQGFNEDKNELLNKILQSGGKQVHELKNGLTKLEEKLKSIGEQQREAHRNLNRFEDRYKSKQANLDALDKEIAEYQKEIEHLDKQADAVLTRGQELYAERESTQEQTEALREKLDKLQDMTHQYQLIFDEKQPRLLELEEKMTKFKESMGDYHGSVKSAHKNCKHALKMAIDDVTNLVAAETPPNPLEVATIVHELRRIDFVNRYVTRKQDEKKRQEQEELENSGSITRRRKKPTTTTTTKSKPHDSDDDDDDDNDKDDEQSRLAIELAEWKEEGNEVFDKTIARPVENQDFIDQYQRALEECNTSIRQRLPWFCPTWQTMGQVNWQHESWKNDRFNSTIDEVEDFKRFEVFTHSCDFLTKKEYERIHGKKNSTAMKDDNGEVKKGEEGEEDGENNNTKTEVKEEQEDGTSTTTTGRGNRRGNATKKTKKQEEEEERQRKMEDLEKHLINDDGKTAHQRALDILANDDDDPEALTFVMTHNLDKLVFFENGPEKGLITLANSRIKNESARLTELVQSIGDVSEDVIVTYHDHRLNAAALTQYLELLTLEREEEKLKYERLKRDRTSMFMKGLYQISAQLKTLYRLLTMGGDAELELSDQNDPFLDGITFSVRPPKKSWKQIQNLSGGEKTLSSLSLVFALHYFKPTPLYVMDEIDAALDYRNVSIVANYIQQRTNNNAQFIIISLRNNMFELSNRLVGIYKTNDRTKSITIDPREYIKNQLMQQQQQQQQQYRFQQHQLQLKQQQQQSPQQNDDDSQMQD